MEDRVKHVVIDTGAFIKNAPVQNIGENLYTVHDVLKEVRDKATRQRLQVLPYDLKFREPSAEVLKIVTDFSKKTGDYRSLSAVDLRLIGLSYHLEKEHCGVDHLKTKPDSKITWTSTTKSLERPTDIAGFYLGKKDPGHSRSTSISENGSINQTTDQLKDLEIEGNNQDEETTEKNVQSENPETDKAEDNKPDIDDVKEKRSIRDGDTLLTIVLQEGDSESEDDEVEDDDDDDGWITPSNIASIKQSIGEPEIQRANVPVACLTTDFAMQNVLLQMGLNVVSVDGMLIKRAKSYVLRCHACYKITTHMTKEFCPNCGNKTLQKVSVTVDENGGIRYCLSRRKAISTRGLKYSLPAPKGGKHAKNPILCEDQREAQQRLSKAARTKYDVMDPDFVTHSSPFAPTDIYSRSGHLGIKGNDRNRRSKNPNENKKVYGRRK